MQHEVASNTGLFVEHNPPVIKSNLKVSDVIYKQMSSGPLCAGTTSKNKPCRKKPSGGSVYCSQHAIRDNDSDIKKQSVQLTSSTITMKAAPSKLAQLLQQYKTNQARLQRHHKEMLNYVGEPSVARYNPKKPLPSLKEIKKMKEEARKNDPIIALELLTLNDPVKEDEEEEEEDIDDEEDDLLTFLPLEGEEKGKGRCWGDEEEGGDEEE